MNGIITFTAVEVSYTPGEYLNLIISTSIEELTKIPGATSSLQFPVFITSCKLGEIKLPDDSCFKCEAGSYTYEIGADSCEE